MITETRNATFLNKVANDPDVRPWLLGEGELDLGPLLADPANYGLQCEAGGFVLTGLGSGAYEVHSVFLPGMGTKPVKAMREAQEWMFTRTDCCSIVSKVPADNKRAKGFAIIGGLRTLFERDIEGMGKIEFVELSLMRWAMDNAGLEKHGERYHSLVEPLGLGEHPHDAAHERAVGAALLMFENGQPQKGEAFYNLWARFAGYPGIGLLKLDPVTVDTGGGVICAVNAGGLEIATCQ